MLRDLIIGTSNELSHVSVMHRMSRSLSHARSMTGMTLLRIDWALIRPIFRSGMVVMLRGITCDVDVDVGDVADNFIKKNIY